MQLELLDRLSHIDSPIHRRSAVFKVVLASFSVFIAVLVPMGYAWVHAVQLVGLLVVYRLSRLPWWYLARRIVFFIPFILIMGLGIPLTRGWQAGGPVMLHTVSGSLLAFISLVLVMATTPVSQLVGALRKLKVPSLFLTIGMLMVRYIVVALDELDRMRRAKSARTVSTSWRTEWYILPNFIGLLFIRSVERSEKVYQAMLARGWNGDVENLILESTSQDQQPPKA